MKCIGLIATISLTTVSALGINPPQTPKRPVTDTYFGTAVVDPYRWLEDWDNPDVKAWSEAQNAYARSRLDALAHTDEIRKRAAELLGAEVVSYGPFARAGSSVIAMKRQPPKAQPFLVIMSDPARPQTQRVLLDPAALDPSGLTSIDWFVPSPDGTLVAVSLSHAGSESGDVSVFDVAGGKKVGETLPRVNGGTAGGSLAWDSDGKGFYYTRYPREGERPAQDMDFFVRVFHHTLGDDPSKDRYEIGDDFPRIGEVMIETGHAEDSPGCVLVSVQKGDGGEFVHFVRLPDAGWTQITRYEDRLVQAALGPGRCVVGVSRLDTPRGKIVRLAFEKDGEPGAWETIVPEYATDALVNDFFDPSCFVVAGDRIIATYQAGGPSRLGVFDAAGKELASPKLPPVSAVGSVADLGNGRVMFSVSTYLGLPRWMEMNARRDDGTTTELGEISPGLDPVIDLSGYEVRREFALSKDRTRVPLNIICRKGTTLDGKNPVLLTGYGGYGVSITPHVRRRDLLLLERGVVIAEANLRGGGEYGEGWHRAGSLTNKQNVFDDFVACADHLIARNYTNAKKLAIEGGSNGGLLMGAAFTQHPELFACVVSHVGIYDMLRVELSPNGAFNVTEFGTVKDRAQFEALYAYSPYHHVTDGAKYPPVLFLTGANDPRVDPMQSRKMTARLQEAGATVLLRTSSNSGHGIGTSLGEQIEQTVDVTAFVLDSLGLK